MSHSNYLLFECLCTSKVQGPTYKVSHFSYAPLFQGPHFLTKMLESNILYINLLIDILSVSWHRKSIKIIHAKRSESSKTILTKMHVQPERLYFLFEFCARHYPWWLLWQKNTKNNYFSQVKTFFGRHHYFLKKCSFWRHINVSYNNQTGFPSPIVLLWVTCWYRSIKTLKHLFIDTSYSLDSSDVITNVNTMTPINP